MRKDKAIIISTHIMEEVEAVCTRAMIISHGKLLFDGTPQELESKSRYRNAVTLTLESQKPSQVIPKLEALDMVASVETNTNGDGGEPNYLVIPKDGKSIVKDLAHLCRAEDWTVDQMHVEPVHMDEVFRSITTAETKGEARS